MDSPSRHTDTLNTIIHFLHTNGLYAAEEALLRELENRYPDIEGSSPTGSVAAQTYLPSSHVASKGNFTSGSHGNEEQGQIKTGAEDVQDARQARHFLLWINVQRNTDLCRSSATVQICTRWKLLAGCGGPHLVSSACLMEGLPRDPWIIQYPICGPLVIAFTWSGTPVHPTLSLHHLQPVKIHRRAAQVGRVLRARLVRTFTAGNRILPYSKSLHFL